MWLSGSLQRCALLLHMLPDAGRQAGGCRHAHVQQPVISGTLATRSLAALQHSAGSSWQAHIAMPASAKCPAHMPSTAQPSPPPTCEFRAKLFGHSALPAKLEDPVERLFEVLLVTVPAGGSRGWGVSSRSVSGASRRQQVM